MYFAQIALARMINTTLPGADVLPWQVDEIPEDWLDAFRVLSENGQTRENARRRVREIKSDWLSKHPTYGK